MLPELDSTTVVAAVMEPSAIASRDDPGGRAILGAAARVRRFELGPHAHIAPAEQALQLDQRRIADGAQHSRHRTAHVPQLIDPGFAGETH